MTIKEAQDLLDNLIGMIEDNHGDDYDTAFKMGIKALESIDKIKAEITDMWKDDPCVIEHGCLNEILEVINKHIGE